MRTLANISILLCLVIGCCGSECSAQVVRLKVTGDGLLGQATAFCIGETQDGGAVFLTARHNFRDSTKAEVKIKGRWIKIRSINKSTRHDVASFETDVPCDAYTLAEGPEIGAQVTIPGFGPEYQGREASYFTGVLQTSHVAGDRGMHPIPGDSGAPILQNGSEVIGVVCGYDSPQTETVYRNDYASQRLPTRYTGLAEIHECLQQCYQQCPPGGCPIWIRNEYRQPVGPLGFARGPVQRVPVAEPVPQVWVPEGSASHHPPEVVEGPQGPAGPPGRDGRSVTREEVESVVNAWLEANRESLVGPAGPPGPPGPPGSAANVTHIENRLTSLEQRPFRIILSSNGKVVDDETYRPGEPVVLDLQRLRSVSSGQ